MAGEYAPTIIDGQVCVWLQSFGWHAAKPIGELVVGDTLVYNFGGTGRVVAVERSASGGSVTLTVVEGGTTYRGKARRASTLVACRSSREA
jgi:hypothetical protein